MTGIIYETSGLVFLFITVILGGGASYLTGRAIAQTWRSITIMILYIIVLALFVRFIHFAMFSSTLLSIYYLLIDFGVLLPLALLGYRITRTNQMVRQYPWIYEKKGHLNWKEKK